MSEFVRGVNERIDEIRTQLAAAREDDDEYLVEILLGRLESLVDLADNNDVDTSAMKQIVDVETGALPVVEDNTAHEPDDG